MSAGEAGGYFIDPGLYDEVYATVTGDVAFHVELAKRARGPVLEVACGSGRVLVPCAEAGADVDGLDLDPVMLAAAREKLEARGRRAGLTLADMRNFTLPRRYALIAIPFNSFLHNLTQADQLATLRRCREHLEPGGRLVLVVFSPDPRMLLANDGRPRLTMEHDAPSGNGRLRVWDAITTDPVEQRNHIARRVERLDAAGTVRTTHEMTFDMRWIWPVEMELLLTAAGFTRCAVEGRGGLRDGFAARDRLAPGDAQVWSAWRDAA